MLSRAISSSNIPLSRKQTLPSRAPTTKSCSSRRSPSTLLSSGHLQRARDVLATMTSAEVDVVLDAQGAGALAVMAQTWRIEDY